jgi:hypothetical protein
MMIMAIVVVRVVVVWQIKMLVTEISKVGEGLSKGRYNASLKVRFRRTSERVDEVVGRLLFLVLLDQTVKEPSRNGMWILTTSP